MKKFFRFLFNIFWVIFVGLSNAISCLILGVATCVLIVPIFFGIPKVYFKAIPLMFAPAGRKVQINFGKAFIRNLLCLIFGGLIQFILNIALAVVLCCTIVFIPLGIQEFKIAKYWLAPFKAEIKKA